MLPDLRVLLNMALARIRYLGWGRAAGAAVAINQWTDPRVSMVPVGYHV